MKLPTQSDNLWPEVAADCDHNLLICWNLGTKSPSSFKTISLRSFSLYFLKIGGSRDLKGSKTPPTLHLHLIWILNRQWHTWYLSFLVNHRIIWVCKKYTKVCVNWQQNCPNWPIFSMLISTPVWKSTPPPVVTIVTKWSTRKKVGIFWEYFLYKGWGVPGFLNFLWNFGGHCFWPWKADFWGGASC